MRKKYQERDWNAVVQSLRLKEKPCEEKEPEVEMRAGQLIAVACEDTWYPGVSARARSITRSWQIYSDHRFYPTPQATQH
ncbi:hypothetical protein ElyMa_005066200 [Elysia marginata]|uniref:Tudor domain-containing protein n=1 Tax=Elysia marginata TaxID=1093978 RepID=A0AAV4JHB4_9GAST|nr:hypothetical protein ElyMa_005066200 [Elysia marginata]